MSMRIRIFVLLPFFALAISGCSGETRVHTGSVVRDSAGIRIVDSDSAHWTTQSPWRIAPEPDLQIGAVDGESPYLFSGIQDVLALEDSTIVVADSRTHELRWFTSDGGHYATAGGEGGGPGEFGRLFGVWPYRGDSVAAYDAALRKVEIFDGSGTYARGVRVDVSLNRASFHYLEDFPHMAGADGNGGLLIMLPRAVRRDVGVGEAWITRTVLHFGSDRAGPDTVVIARTGRTEVRQVDPSIQLGSRHFSSSVDPVAGPHGIFEANPDQFEIRRYTSNGELNAVFRRSHEQVRVTPEHVSAERSRVLDRAPMPAMRGRMAELFDARTVPESFPVARRLLVDDDGNVWIEGYPVAEVIAPTWYVFDVDGGYLGELPMPEDFRPNYIGSDFILGIWHDDYNVPYVRRYRLMR
jgi:hypothetical protein